MTRGFWHSEPAGIAADCFWVLAMYGGEQTTRRLYELIARENEALDWHCPSWSQVEHALHGLAARARPLVEQDGRGRGARWRLTEHGHAMAFRWAGSEDEPPDREPCGLGWPASSRGA